MRKIASGKIIRHFVYAEFFMFVFLMGNLMVFLLQFQITVEPLLATTSPRQPVFQNTESF